MKPIKINSTIRGEKLEIEIRQFKTIYSWRGFDYIGLGQLGKAMQFYDTDLNGDDIGAIELDIAKDELRELTRLYAIVTSERTASDLICELSDLGVEAQSIRIPCAGDNCDEVAIEDLDHYQPIADLVGFKTIHNQNTRFDKSQNNRRRNRRAKPSQSPNNHAEAN